MIKYHEKCDKLILVSGDLDYAEAVQFVKDNLKKVHIVRFFRGSPPINKSVSRTLMALADKVIDVYEKEIKDSHLISN
ncbi:MAG: NYN domain-containing protein [Nitrosomonadales bacterium]|nr:NYN domain-containing protein [Nitrosomonadales bacterium]